MTQCNISVDEIQHAMCKFITSFPKYDNQIITPLRLSDGYIFNNLLSHVSSFNLGEDQMVKSDNWMHKLSNLKKLIDHIEDYFEKHLDKGLRTRDIDLVEIAKTNSMDQLVKLFEVVMAVLMESANKEDYIEIIMALDQRSQSAFVSIIQNAMELRSTTVEEVRKTKMIHTIEQLTSENNHLKDQIIDLNHNAMEVKKYIEQLKAKIAYYEQQMVNEQTNVQPIIDQLPHQNQQLKNMVHNLKEKLLSTAIEHETQISRMKEEVSLLQGKNIKLTQSQQSLLAYKERYESMMQQSNKVGGLEKEKAKLNRIIEEKDNTIKKLQDRVNEEVEKNYLMEERELYLKMELEKKQVRLSSSAFHVDQSLQDNLALSEKSRDDNLEMKHQLSRNQAKLSQMQKQNKSLLARLERLTVVQGQKKKLQQAIQQLDKTRTDQMLIILASLDQLRQENIKLNQELKKHQSKIKSK